MENLVMPQSAKAPRAIGRRRDELWRSTCFEMFMKRRDDPGYWEFNVAPSGDWAAYRFTKFRDGMENEDAVEILRIEQDRRPDGFRLEAEIDAAALPLADGCGLQLGFSAVLEDRHGETAYWALAHPPGKPDFHHVSNFAYRLPPEPLS